MKNLRLFLLAGLLVSAASAQVVLYEGDTWPESVWWERVSTTHPADRWIDAGWLIQYTTYDGQTGPEQDKYRRILASFAGSPSFFVEWRLMTDGSREAIPWVAPAFLVVSGTTGVIFHFTIAEDQMRFIDSDLNTFLFDIEPGIPHTYRVDVRRQPYSFFIDGQEVNVGTAPQDYPTLDSTIIFGVNSPAENATTRWDYIRFGKFFDGQPGDLNCDGSISLFDIDPFVQALSNPDAYGQSHPACNRMLADTNGDGSVSQFDIVPFVDMLVH